jgi:hypothetical protein
MITVYKTKDNKISLNFSSIYLILDVEAPGDESRKHLKAGESNNNNIYSTAIGLEPGGRGL